MPQQSASPPSPTEASSFSSMHSSESHQVRHARAGYSAPKPMFAGLLFLEAGIVALALPTDFNRIDSAACASCQQLETVDLSQADVLEILGSAFAHFSQ